MRVVVSAPFVREGHTGIARHLRGLLDALAAPEFCQDEFVVLWPPDVPWPEFPTHLRCEPWPFAAGGGAGHPVGRILREGAFVQRLYRKTRFDLFHSPFGYLPLRLPTPGIVTLHDLRVLRYPQSFSRLRGAFLRWAIPQSLRRAAQVVTISQFTRDEVLALVPGLHPERLSVAYPGLDPFWFAPPESAAVALWRERLGRFALAVGTTEMHKNLPCLLDAHARRRDMDRTLALVGETFATGKSQRLELPEGVACLGRVDDATLRALYAACAVYCFPSRYEGFGYPPLEALAVGTPVVAADIPALREVLSDVVAFADPDNPVALARALERAHDRHDPDQGREWAARYRWDRHAGQVRDRYRAALP